MTTAQLLNADDRCRCLAYLSTRYDRWLLNPTHALYAAVEKGLDGENASDELMQMAVERGLDTTQSDQLGHAEHLAAIADMVSWTLNAPWDRPENVMVGSHDWESGCFLNSTGSRLRRVVLVDRWNDERRLSESHDWRTMGECAAYGLPMDLFVVVLGQQRDGRRHGAFSKGWTHPVAKDLRFRKRDGSGFDGNWKPVFREHTNFTKEHWLDSMTADGVLADSVFIEEVLPRKEVRELMIRKLQALPTELPDPQLSQCDGISPCLFRSECHNFRLPAQGFVTLPC